MHLAPCQPSMSRQVIDISVSGGGSTAGTGVVMQAPGRVPSPTDFKGTPYKEQSHAALRPGIPRGRDHRGGARLRRHRGCRGRYREDPVFRVSRAVRDLAVHGPTTTCLTPKHCVICLDQLQPQRCHMKIPTIKKSLALTALLLSLTVLAACNTMQGAGKDIQKAGETI